MTLVKDAIAINADSVVDLNVHVLKKTCAYLNIPFNMAVVSEMNLEIPPVTNAGEWALNISKAVRAKEYINPLGGIELFNNLQFERDNIRLSFLKNTASAYNQHRSVFEPNLSIIDALMFNDPATVSFMLDEIEIIEPCKARSYLEAG